MAMLALIYSRLPLGTALEIGGDEGYELMKGFLCSKGFAMYKDIWCDQPPLYPNLLGYAFQMFGPSILVARLVAVAFGMVMLAAFYQLVRQSTGAWAALLAGFFLLASPSVLLLSAAVMVEVPAIGTALVSAWLALRWAKRRHWPWLVAAGVMMGLALEIKLTAVMVLPAILAQIVVSGWDNAVKAVASRQDVRARSKAKELIAGPLRACVWAVLQFGLAAAVAFLAIAWIWGEGSWQSSWRSHTQVQHVAGLGSPEDYRFQGSLLLKHSECLLGAVIALYMLGRLGRWRELLFPVVMLATGLTVHSLHRPFWGLYYLHLAVPLAWLSGVGFTELLKAAQILFWTGRTGVPFSTWGKCLAGAVLGALALAVSEVRIEAAVKSIRQHPKVSGSALLAKMRQYSPRTHWVYAQPVIYPFHAGLPVPPKIAVVMLKRYWSGQITPVEIVDVCRQYKPEQLVLYRPRAGGEWTELLKTDYRQVYEDANCLLYVSKGILSEVGAGESSARSDTSSTRALP